LNGKLLKSVVKNTSIVKVKDNLILKKYQKIYDLMPNQNIKFLI